MLQCAKDIYNLSENCLVPVTNRTAGFGKKVTTNNTYFNLRAILPMVSPWHRMEKTTITYVRDTKRSFPNCKIAGHRLRLNFRN
jgi:hypothetical protein